MASQLRVFSLFCLVIFLSVFVTDAAKQIALHDNSEELGEDSSSEEHGCGGHHPHHPPTTSTEPSTTVNPNEFCKNKPNGNYANPATCMNFIMCSNGYGYVFDCPEDLVYNAAIDACDWPSNVPGCN